MRGSRLIRTSLRTLHLLAFGVYYGGAVFGVADARLEPAFVAVLASGMVFMLFEVVRSPIWLVQARGLATYVKFALLIASEIFREARVPILTCTAVIGAVISHMPSRYRYYSFVHGRPIEGEKG
jgi:hypothetical protein